MKDRTRLWLHKLVAAVVGGGAGAVTATVTVSIIDPEKFNLGAQFGNFFKLAAITFGVNGFLSAMAYLKQSPVPPDDDPPPLPPPPALRLGLFFLGVLLLVVPGCSTRALATLATALAKDPATVSAKVTTIYGTAQLTRVGAQTNNSVIVSPDGTITLKPGL